MQMIIMQYGVLCNTLSLEISLIYWEINHRSVLYKITMNENWPIRLPYNSAAGMMTIRPNQNKEGPHQTFYYTVQHTPTLPQSSILDKVTQFGMYAITGVSAESK